MLGHTRANPRAKTQSYGEASAHEWSYVGTAERWGKHYPKNNLASAGGDLQDDYPSPPPAPFMFGRQDTSCSINPLGEAADSTPFDYDEDTQVSPNLTQERLNPGAFEGLQTTMQRQQKAALDNCPLKHRKLANPQPHLYPAAAFGSHRQPLSPNVSFIPTPGRPLRQTVSSFADTMPLRYTTTVRGMPTPAGTRHQVSLPKNEFQHQANAAFHQHQYKKARDLYSKALTEQAGANNPDILRCRAACHAWLGDLRGALYDTKKLAEVLHHSSKARFLHRVVADAINAVNRIDDSPSTLWSVCQYLTPDEFKANDYRARMLANEAGPKPPRIASAPAIRHFQKTHGIPCWSDVHNKTPARNQSHGPTMVTVKDLNKALPSNWSVPKYTKKSPARYFWEHDGFETRKIHGKSIPNQAALPKVVPVMNFSSPHREGVRGSELQFNFTHT